MARISDRQPIGRLGMIVVDCPDPERLAPFWCEVLGVGIKSRLGDPPEFVTLELAEPGAVQVGLQRVPEPKSTKNRLHFDIDVDDVDAACERIEQLGGRRRDDHDFHEFGSSWRRMADPEGNEFCLIYDA